MSHQKLPTIKVKVVKVNELDRRIEWRIRRDGDAGTVFHLKRRRCASDLTEEIDAQEIKQRFLAIRSEPDALSFLQQTSNFLEDSKLTHIAVSDLFWYRDWFKKLAVWPLAKWKQWGAENQTWNETLAKPLDVSIAFTKTEGGEPEGRIVCQCTFDAILSQLKLEKICKSEYKRCERPDCQEVYKRESGHARKYCSQRCAHLVAVRRSRQVNLR